MRKLRNCLLFMMALMLSCQFVWANGWWQHNKHHNGESADSVSYSISDSTYHHFNHHHNDSIDYDSIYQDSVFIYHHGHHHFVCDSISYDSLRHDSTSTYKHENDSVKIDKFGWCLGWNKGWCENWHKDWKDFWGNFWNKFYDKYEQQVDTFYYNNILYVDSMTIEPGTTSVLLPIMLKNESEITEISFRIGLPEGISIAIDSLGEYEVVLDTVRATSSSKLKVQDKKHTSEMTFKYTSKRHPLASGEGAIAYMTVNLSDTLAAGDYTIELSGVKMTDKKEKDHRCYTACTALTIASSQVKEINNFEPSAIKQITTSSAKSSAYFDLNGRKIATPKSGEIYIHNGKKMIQK